MTGSQLNMVMNEKYTQGDSHKLILQMALSLVPDIIMQIPYITTANDAIGKLLPHGKYLMFLCN